MAGSLTKSTGPQEAQLTHDIEHYIPDLPPTGRRIGKYTDAEHFNDGLFSEVFRAYDPESRANTAKPEVVALKITNPTMEQPPHDSVREARLLTVGKSDHIIRLLETFQQAGGHFVLVFPYMPFDLNKLLHERRLTPQSRKTILSDLFSGLKHLHSLNIIHRDVKPSNVLLATPKGPAYLADFGIAWSSPDPASEPADQKILDVGTTCYRPPELLFGNTSYSTKLDMWAAGCVAAQIVCLNGKTLFDAGDLGSDLALIKSMFQVLGTPDLDVWPEAERMPDWGKMNFVKYPGTSWDDVLQSADETARDLVQNLVVFESSRRLSAEEVGVLSLLWSCLTANNVQALKHSYLC